MLKNFSIKKILIFSGILIVLFSSLNLVVNITELNSVENKVKEKEYDILPTVFNFLELQKDVIQVQQWLTDVSATRGAEGYDDGFKIAKEYFDAGNKLLDEIIQGHKQKKELKFVEDLENFKIDFNKYYEIGFKMANSYVKYGPEQGNKLMSELDPFSTKLTEKLDFWIEKHIKENKDKATEIDELIEFTKKKYIYARSFFNFIKFKYIFNFDKKNFHFY